MDTIPFYTVHPDLDGLLATVAPVDRSAAQAAEARQARLAKPTGSLGRLEELGTQLAAIAGTCPPPAVTRPALILAAADHGAHAHGVTPWPQEVTAAMVDTFCAGGATANALAGPAGAQLRVLDAGVATPLSTGDHPLLRRAGIRAGTRDISETDAMTRDECAAAVRAGADAAEELLDAGADLLIGGEMGIGNTTAAAALIAQYTGRAAGEVTGRGTGVDEPTYQRKVAVVARALARHRAEAGEPGGPGATGPRAGLATLAALGGLEHAALAGVMLAGAARRVPVLLDGVSTVAAALAGTALCPILPEYLIAAHRSPEPGATAGLAQLGLEPLLELGMRLGEGTGALAATGLIRAAAAVLREVRTLDDLGFAG